MRKFLLLILLMYPVIASAEAKTFNFTVQNNTALNFEDGYYIIEVIGINYFYPRFVKVNLTIAGESKVYNIYLNENPYLSSPYNIIDIRATSISETSADLSIEIPEDWSYPERYTIEIKRPHIVVTKSVDKDNITVGDVIGIKIIVENIGNGTAKGLRLEESFPPGFTLYLSSFPPQLQDTLDAGKKVELYYSLKAVNTGTFIIQPTVVTYGTKSIRSNSLTIRVNEPLEKKANLASVITLNKYNITTGESVKVNIRITNTGDAAAESVYVKGELPQGLEVIEGDTTRYYKIDPGESKEYTFTLKPRKPGNYSISLKINDGITAISSPLVVTKNEKDYLYIIIPIGIIVIGIALFTLKRYKEYSY